MIRILIADDHPIVRQGLKQILAEEPDMRVEGEAQNSQEVLQLVVKQAWDVIILDITMPGRGGMDVLRIIKHDYPHLPVLVLSMHPEDQYGVRALKAGAEGYMTKESAPGELVKAIRKIVAGGKYLTPALAEKIAFVFTEKNHGKSPHEKLSDREYQILRMIASGKSVGEIAAELFLSPKTISTYRSRILNKMGMKNNAELIHYAIQNRLV